MCLGIILGKALAPLNCCRIAEPELFLGGVGGVRARAADVDGLLLAFLATTPSPHVMFPLAAWLATSSPLDCRRRCSYGINHPCFLICCSLRQANPILFVDKHVRETSKELEAACLPVVCTDDLLEKKVCINANDAEDSEVEPSIPMSGGEVVVHPQLIGTDC